MSAEQSDPAPGPQSSKEERQAHLTDTPRGAGWRMFSAPIEVEAYLNQIWVPVMVDGIDDDSAEIWARWPPHDTHPSEDVHHQVIDASHYRPPKGGFPAA